MERLARGGVGKPRPRQYRGIAIFMSRRPSWSSTPLLREHGLKGVSATLRDMCMPQIDRLPASTALPSYSSAPPPEEEEEAAAESIELRRELRSSDRALSDLRTELWQAQERCRRLATEVWRMDGERTRCSACKESSARS